MNILAKLRSRFRAALAGLASDSESYLAMVRPAQDARFGDFQANCAMPLAKELSRKPRDIAADIVARLDVDDLCEPPEIAGPGFINLRLRDDWLAEHTYRLAADDRLGVAEATFTRTIVVDYSAPNVAKPMHVGHLRSTVIGDCLCRVLRFLGHTVIGDNHIGDWGTQFGMIIYGYKHFRGETAYQRDPVGELARLYRLVNQLADYYETAAGLPRLRKRLEGRRTEVAAAEGTADPNDKAAQKDLKRQRSQLGELKSEIATAECKIEAVRTNAHLNALADAHPDIAEAARQETAKLHAGDAENVAMWNEFLPACRAALDAVYERLDVHFDKTLGESFYQPMLADVVTSLKESGLAVESEGAVCVFIEGTPAPFIVQKSDGAYTYATTDLATIKYRIEELHADEILYVVDARQSDHFKLLFESARRSGLGRKPEIRSQKSEGNEGEHSTLNVQHSTFNAVAGEISHPSLLIPHPPADSRPVEFRHVSFGTILGDDRRPFKTRAGDTVGLESLLDEAIARARRIVDENDDAKRDETGNPAPELDDAARQQIAEIVGLGGIKYAGLRRNRESDYVFSWDKMLAKEGDTATYMQYAYARVCGIFRKAGADRAGVRSSVEQVKLSTPAERALGLSLCRFADAIDDVVADCRPNVLTQYLFELAGRFSTFYNECPVKDEPDETLRASRYALCDLTARVLARGLDLLGIRTSERM